MHDSLFANVRGICARLGAVDTAVCADLAAVHPGIVQQLGTDVLQGFCFMVHGNIQHRFPWLSSGCSVATQSVPQSVMPGMCCTQHAVFAERVSQTSVSTRRNRFRPATDQAAVIAWQPSGF